MVENEKSSIEKINMTYKRLSDITTDKLNNTLDAYFGHLDPDIGIVKTSFIMMVSETRKCLVDRFLTNSELKKIYMNQEKSIEHFIWAYEMLMLDHSDVASDLYNMYIGALVKVKNYALSIECYEVADNLDRFIIQVMFCV